jgi:DNA-binding MarR family transcriptional regulator
MQAELIKSMIDELEIFQAEVKLQSPTINDFKNWLKNQGDAKSLVDSKRTGPYDNVETQLSRLLIFNYRYAKLRIRKDMQLSPIKNIDEFAFLATLLPFESLSKMELIEKNVIEKTTGFEIMKRLKAQKLIKEIANPNDGRSILVMITDKGKKEILKSFQQMSKANTEISDVLDTNEKYQLASILYKLQSHHHPYYLESLGR